MVRKAGINLDYDLVSESRTKNPKNKNPLASQFLVLD